MRRSHRAQTAVHPSLACLFQPRTPLTPTLPQEHDHHRLHTRLPAWNVDVPLLPELHHAGGHPRPECADGYLHDGFHHCCKSQRPGYTGRGCSQPEVRRGKRVRSCRRGAAGGRSGLYFVPVVYLLSLGLLAWGWARLSSGYDSRSFLTTSLSGFWEKAGWKPRQAMCGALSPDGWHVPGACRRMTFCEVVPRSNDTVVPRWALILVYLILSSFDISNARNELI